MSDIPNPNTPSKARSLEMSDINFDVFREILLWVPAESLLRFRAVCKAWKATIDDPSFINSHALTQSRCSTTLLIKTSGGTRLLSFPLESINFSADGPQTIDVNPLRTVIRRGMPHLRYFSPVASCNGLILGHVSFGTFLIWNPFTRGFHKLPNQDPLIGSLHIGFGYRHSGDDYRVVRIGKTDDNENSVYRTFVYSLKSDSWKKISDFPGDFPRWVVRGVFLNGSLHWCVLYMVIVLDLNTEDYRKMPVPPEPAKQNQLIRVHLDALSGCLMLIYYYAFDRFNVWVMKDYGVKNAWMKLFSLQKLDVGGALEILEPIAYLKSRGQVLFQHRSEFFLIDIEKNSFKKVMIQGLPDSFCSQICPGSLFPLSERYDIGKVNKRLKPSVTITDVPCSWFRENKH